MEFEVYINCVEIWGYKGRVIIWDSMIPFRALDLIKKDVTAGKLDKDIYAKFIYSLS